MTFSSISMHFALTVLSNEKNSRDKGSGDSVMRHLSGDRGSGRSHQSVAQVTKL